nr:S-crystallin SL11 [Crassostrea gigas]
MGKFKLLYFASKGRGQPIRLLLHIAGVDFDDVNVTLKEWKDIKANMPHRKLPVLEVDGNLIPQSGAILRYLGREFGYYGSNNAEKTRIDVISGAVDDIIFLMERLFYNETVEAAKENLKKEMVSWRLEEFLGIMEETLKENHNGDKCFVGDQVSIADIQVYNVLDVIPEYFSDHAISMPPKLTAFMQRFIDIQNVKNFLDKT